MPGVEQASLQQVAGGGLAGGAGNADNRQVSGGVAVNLGGNGAEHGTNILHHQDGAGLLGLGKQVEPSGVGKHGSSLGIASELRAVYARARQGSKERAFRQTGRIQPARGDLHGGITNDAPARKLGESIQRNGHTKLLLCPQGQPRCWFRSRNIVTIK